MIRRLNGHSLQEAGRFSPESMPLTLCERQSQASIAIGPEVPEIIVGDWLQDMDEPGAGIVWRVKTVEKQPLLKSRTVQLEHLINTLRDEVMFGEVKPKDITGNSSATTCTALEAVEYILGRQSIWTLGSFDGAYSNISHPYSFNGENLFAALETVCASLEDSYWEYDMSSLPFTISIKKLDSDVDSEMRASRNIQTLRYTVDRTRMYTRFYPIGKNNLHIDSVYVSRNEGIYGVISKVETDQSRETKEELLRWANERIARHCEPSVTVTISGLDLSEATGEPLDHFTINRQCRVPLPDYGTTITEKVTKLQWADKIKEPEKVTVTLANLLEDVASIINSQNASSGRSGRAGAKQNEEDHAWFVDTTDHVAMVAEAVAGEGAAEDWSRVAEVLVDGNGIHQRVTQAEGDIVTAYSLIDQTATAIRLEIGTVASEVRSFIEQTPVMIHAEVGYAVSGLAHSVIEQTATYIRMEVNNAASAISQSVIEQTTEYVQTTVSAVASGVAWSVITQTMTNIEQQIARKSKIYIQPTDPNNGTNVLYEGDVWVKSEANKTWDSLSGTTWDELESRKWKSFYGDEVYVWRSGAWVLVKDTSVDVDNYTKIDQTDEHIALIARAVDASGQVFNSNLEVTARQIRSEVSTAQSKVYSVIEQTATHIRSQVADEINGLQSSIEQTSTYIYTSVSAAKSTLWSSIMQTATGVVTTVMDEVSENYSTITQTSTSIALAVSSAKSSLSASIKVQADRIGLLVEGSGSSAKVKQASIILAINGTGGSNAIISADKINLNGYVKSSQLDTSWLSGKIAQISSVNGNTLSFANVDAGRFRFRIGSGSYTYADFKDIFVTGLTLTRSGDTYTLKCHNYNQVDTVIGSFSRATTLSGTWSGRQFTVTASPQGDIKIGKVYNGVIVLSNAPEYRTAGGHHYIKQYVRIYSEDENGDADTTIMDHGVEFNADLAYEDGVANAPNPYPNSLVIARTRAGRTSSGTDLYYGKLYFWDDDDGSYTEAYSGNAYWYRSSTNLGSGNKTVHY